MRQTMSLQLTPKLKMMPLGITPDSGVDAEKVAKRLLRRFNSDVEKIKKYLNESFSVATGKARSRLTQLDIISRDPALRANLLYEINTNML